MSIVCGLLHAMWISCALHSLYYRANSLFLCQLCVGFCMPCGYPVHFIHYIIELIHCFYVNCVWAFACGYPVHFIHYIIELINGLWTALWKVQLRQAPLPVCLVNACTHKCLCAWKDFCVFGKWLYTYVFGKWMHIFMFGCVEAFL